MLVETMQNTATETEKTQQEPQNDGYWDSSEAVTGPESLKWIVIMLSK
jgi:hypothetical protein